MKAIACLFMVILFSFSLLANSAPRRGDGIVYHRSDCGKPNVRFYGFGGDGPGSTCSFWMLSSQQRGIIWSDGKKNWICNATLEAQSENYSKCAIAYSNPERYSREELLERCQCE